MKRSCPRLRFEFAPTGGTDILILHAFTPDGGLAGKIIGEPVTLLKGGGERGYSAKMMKVDPSLHRCGIGTTLYTKLAQEVCRRGLKLESDAYRTRPAEMFLRKQLRAGRATCIGREGVQMRYDEGVGFRTVEGKRWPCTVYRLNCPVTSLAGAHRRW